MKICANAHSENAYFVCSEIIYFFTTNVVHIFTFGHSPNFSLLALLKISLFTSPQANFHFVRSTKFHCTAGAFSLPAMPAFHYLKLSANFLNAGNASSICFVCTQYDTLTYPGVPKLSAGTSNNSNSFAFSQNSRASSHIALTNK